jgi:hypothetical protein
MSPHAHLPVRPSALRVVAAAALHAASAGLERIARRLAAAAADGSADADVPHVEFHAEAGALEGALYVDGQFVGLLPGVSRL